MDGATEDVNKLFSKFEAAIADGNTETNLVEDIMKTMLALPIALLLALNVPALAGDGNDQGQNNNSQGRVTRGAPGPLAGASLPLLLIGGGIYWLVRRRNRAS